MIFLTNNRGVFPMKLLKQTFLINSFLLLIIFISMGQRNIYAASENHSGHEHEEHAPKADAHDNHGDKHEEHGDEHEEGGIKLGAESRSMIQLKTEQVQRRKLEGRLKVYGKIAKDTENYSYVTFNDEGRVELVDVELGATVNKGDVLLTVRKNDDAIEQVKSKIHGVIFSIFVKPGDRIDRLSSILSIVDIDKLRATIDIYEKDLRFVKVGQKVVLAASAFPDEEFMGRVVYISPQVDEHTQSIKARVDVDNDKHLLRLGMFVSGEVIYATDKRVLTVPAESVQSLNGEDVVFVSEEGDHFERRDVVLGQRVDDYIEIKKGVREGETVVTRGSFYLKSEQAKEAFGDGHNH